MVKYKAKVVGVYDGDTITCDIDLGFGIVLHSQKIRLYGINTPEVRGKERDKGLIVRDIVKDMILDKDITLETIDNHKKGKYGRWLGKIYTSRGLFLNEWLVINGHSDTYMLKKGDKLTGSQLNHDHSQL